MNNLYPMISILLTSCFWIFQAMSQEECSKFLEILNTHTAKVRDSVYFTRHAQTLSEMEVHAKSAKRALKIICALTAHIDSIVMSTDEASRIKELLSLQKSAHDAKIDSQRDVVNAVDLFERMRSLHWC